MIEQEDFDQKIGWFGGLFSVNGTFNITRSGKTLSGYPRFRVSASVSTHVSRREVLLDIIKLFGIGHVLQRKSTYYNRDFWIADTIADTTVTVELLEGVVWPLPTYVIKQIGIIRRFLDTKIDVGYRQDTLIYERVSLQRLALQRELQELTAWKKSLEKRGEVDVVLKRVEGRLDRKG